MTRYPKAPPYTLPPYTVPPYKARPPLVALPYC
jgi:hypothetical protein